MSFADPTLVALEGADATAMEGADAEALEGAGVVLLAGLEVRDGGREGGWETSSKPSESSGSD
jgi:hypothetical protein